jgi:hypothetical protein
MVSLSPFPDFAFALLSQSEVLTLEKNYVNFILSNRLNTFPLFFPYSPGFRS